MSANSALRLLLIVECTGAFASMAILGLIPYFGFRASDAKYISHLLWLPFAFQGALFLTSIGLSFCRHPFAKRAYQLFLLALVWMLLVAFSLPAIT